MLNQKSIPRKWDIIYFTSGRYTALPKEKNRFVYCGQIRIKALKAYEEISEYYGCHFLGFLDPNGEIIGCFPESQNFFDEVTFKRIGKYRSLERRLEEIMVSRWKNET